MLGSGHSLEMLDSMVNICYTLSNVNMMQRTELTNYLTWEDNHIE